MYVFINLIFFHELLLESDPHDVLAKSKSTLLTYYAQVWALARFLKDGEDGRYRPALENVLLLTAQGDLESQVSTAEDSEGRACWLLSRKRESAMYAVAYRSRACLTEDGMVETLVDSEDLAEQSTRWKILAQGTVRPGTLRWNSVWKKLGTVRTDL